MHRCLRLPEERMRWNWIDSSDVLSSIERKRRQRIWMGCRMVPFTVDDVDWSSMVCNPCDHFLNRVNYLDWDQDWSPMECLDESELESRAMKQGSIDVSSTRVAVTSWTSFSIVRSSSPLVSVSLITVRARFWSWWLEDSLSFNGAVVCTGDRLLSRRLTKASLDRSSSVALW